MGRIFTVQYLFCASTRKINFLCFTQIYLKWLLIPPVDQNPCFCYFCFTTFIILACVVDLDSLNPDPDPAFQVNPDPDFGSRVLMTKNLKNTAEKIFFFDQKWLFSYPQASIKNVQATGEAFSRHFCPPGTGSGLRIGDPDLQH